MILNDELEWMCKEALVAFSKYILPRRTEEKYENP
jgi:hypothetical protein